MIRILFICHGNICRSPMAEFILKDMVEKRGIADRFYIKSAATSTEEIWGGVGNPVHPGTRAILDSLGISCVGKRAVQIQKQDYSNYDYLICMDSMNVRNVEHICGKDQEHKIYKLLEFTDSPRDVADPWYTGNFDVTCCDVVSGLEGFLTFLEKRNVL